MIKTKPIARQCIDIHTKEDLFDWFEKEYRLALEYIGIRSRKYIYNINEKKRRISCPIGKKVIVLIRIKEMYIRVPENQMSLTVVESISTDRKAIPPTVIVPRWKYIESWFHENITGYELLTLSPFRYINKGICLICLDYFIKHNNCRPNKPWRILLIDSAKYHEAPEFILKAKINRIWLVKFPSH